MHARATYRNRKRATAKPFTYYGENVEDGSFIPPLSPVVKIDDVTGKPIPEAFMGIQDGLLKDVRFREGSWENWWRNEQNIFFTYDASIYGVQVKPAGLGKEEYNE